MSLTPEEVKKIAYLARLNVAENDIAVFTDKLSHMINFIEQMSQVDTSQTEPLSHPLDLSQRVREDKVTEPDLREKYQKIAPDVEAGFYIVPKVIDEA